MRGGSLFTKKKKEARQCNENHYQLILNTIVQRTKSRSIFQNLNILILECKISTFQQLMMIKYENGYRKINGE